MIQIVLADDHKLFRDGLRKILELDPEVKVVGEASNGEEALQLLQERSPDIVLFDINMPRMDGIQLAREINSRKLKVATIAVSAYDDEDCLATLSAEGVMGFVLKSSGRTELIAAIRAAYQHEPYVDPRVAGKLMTSFAKRKNENDLLGELSRKDRAVREDGQEPRQPYVEEAGAQGPHSGRDPCLEGRVRPDEPRGHGISRG